MTTVRPIPRRLTFHDSSSPCALATLSLMPRTYTALTDTLLSTSSASRGSLQQGMGGGGEGGGARCKELGCLNEVTATRREGGVKGKALRQWQGGGVQGGERTRQRTLHRP